MKETINELVKDIHETNKLAGWWDDPITGESLLDNPYVIGTKFMLVTTEVAEAVQIATIGLCEEYITVSWLNGSKICQRHIKK